MKLKLSQIIAIEKGAKARLGQELTNLHRDASKIDLFIGFTKTYQPKEEGGESFPPEQKKVQMRSEEVLSSVKGILSELVNVSATKDFGNMGAVADIVVDGNTLVKGAPVPFLLSLEKSLVDLRTFVTKMPVLDDAEDWKKDEATGLFKTEPTNTHRTAKVQEAIVLYDATEKHPAQTQLITKDVVVGHWSIVKQSAAITRGDKKSLLEKVEKVLDATKIAREEANGVEVTKKTSGNDLFGYIFG